ncbi:GlpR1 [Desulforapulum autotrophicum HRM2]|uniref:GlpR1 n=1 Tax=Desulforapulum autotrophicum (strain ATCC 43914 / DSM 3382 / VKM B-1955 / HRM2) TaxID=177437 RepID=C0QCW1_DESAH|nr:DeoR/GlpR family DNA-binding transcription regulator [Desulforapulum autotrophicum]ACN17193.1 GlpR1 [Desulforapulum autotrophicum HRM2]
MNTIQLSPFSPDKGFSLSDRQTRMAEMIRQRGFIRVDVLAQNFQVTSQTIRRDLNLLCEHGIARRTHGGVQKLEMPGNLSYAWRQILNSHAKQAIAREVARHVPNRVSVALGIGTTPEIVFKALLDHGHLRIVTNNMTIAMLACANPTFDVTIAGGRLRNAGRDVMGDGMETLFKAYKVDIGIYGVAGVDEDGTLLDLHEEEVKVRQIIRQNCRSAYLVLDQTKFGRAAHVRGGKIDEATKVFCDGKPPEPIPSMIRRSGGQLMVCGQGNTP